MRTPRLLRTATFRFAFFFAALFAISAVALVAFFDFAISRYVEQSLRSDVAAELRLLLQTAPRGDPAAVATLVRQREQALGAQEFLYLVRGAGGGVLAGDLPGAAARHGWGAVAIPAPPDNRESDTEMAEVRTLGVRLPGGGLLVVGRSTYPFHELRESLARATIAAGALISLMSLLVALLVGRRFLARIDRVSAAAGRIMAGGLEARLPAIGMGDEFDRLALNLNAMLDRIHQLMDGLRQVSSDIAHDLRTPLMRLRRRLEAALTAEADGPARSALMAEALGQLDGILSTFGALLRIAQVEGGTGREGFRPVDLSELMERLRQVYEPVAEDKGKRLTPEIVPGVTLAGDEELLTQLISNLIENAFAHAAGSAAIRLSVTMHRGGPELTIADRGPGVPAAERAKVLQRFYRLDRTRGSPGAGLGLAMAHAIVRLHGGELELMDNQPGLIVRARFGGRTHVP